MNEKKLKEIEEFFLISSQYGVKETSDKLIAEVRRLNDKYENVRELLCGANRERVKERDQLLEDIQLYKELFIVANSKNMAYTMVLEKHISILRSVLQVIKNQIDYDEGIALGGVIVQLEKALEGETNES